MVWEIFFYLTPEMLELYYDSVSTPLSMIRLSLTTSHVIGLRSREGVACEYIYFITQSCTESEKNLSIELKFWEICVEWIGNTKISFGNSLKYRN